MTASDGASSISVTVRVRPFTIREAAQLAKTDDGPFFLGDGSLACAPTPQLKQKGLKPVIKVVDDKCLYGVVPSRMGLDAANGYYRVFDPPDDNPVQRLRSQGPQGKRVKDQTFVFDKVFDENTTQGDVYEATTKTLLDSVLEGYNATVFAYGATGCGKTHTITGTAQAPGIIFLTMQELFERIQDVQEEKVTEISLSYLEIYNETIRDLLVPGGSKQSLMLREDANQAVSVAGLTSHHPQNVQEVMDIIVRGNEYRTMSPTEANATSSRSHAVLQINVSQKDRNADVNEPHTMATLSIIDLAGSERASATKNRGERLLEGANINKSLLALGSCINALCDPRKRNHVPYRNSKLTRLLKFSLGGNCRTVMIVCVSPSSAHFDETQNTLRYANRAKNIQTKVTKNVYNVNRHVKDYLKKIDEQRILIDELKAREGSRETGFDTVTEIREDEEPPKSLVAMRKTALGIQAELESSRQHYHQRLAKNNWERAVETAVQTGLRQLKESDGASDGSEASSLIREAELLRSNADREAYTSVLEQEKGGDAAIMQVLLQAHFETIAILGQIMVMDEAEAVKAARNLLGKISTACLDATSQVIKPDGGLPITEAFPPTKSGTPKRKKAANLMAPSPMRAPISRPSLLDAPHLGSSPMKGSPRRRKMGGAKKGVTFTPKKKSPVKGLKRGVRWKDDTEDGALAEFQVTPQPIESTPDQSTVELQPPPLPTLVSASDLESSPAPHRSSLHNVYTAPASSDVTPASSGDNSSSSSSDEAEKPWSLDGADAKKIRTAIKRDEAPPRRPMVAPERERAVHGVACAEDGHAGEGGGADERAESEDGAGC
ncbi:tubulin-dependent ATPase kip3 [Coniosporium tulheliwenetii]|uniref:Tubulin-dependent ATPase kip3 n=1 Tax=Coniosporium tulheliwenetii TaxID=3383036 RepID=A0ACC2YLZ7_9PEZI|nr:tubulin-dependent ATPase kip3 [Cladosporium sp. JES 115]